MLTVKVLGIKTADVHEVSTPQPVNKVAVFTPAQQQPVVHVSQAPENTGSALPVKKSGIGGRGIIEYLANLTMVQYYFGIKDIDGPYWTLVVELLFYVFMAILFQFNLLKSIEAIGAGILAFTLFHVTLIQHYTPAVFEGINRAIPLINHFPLFFSGILFYSMFTGKADVKKYALLLASFGIQLTLFHSGGKSRYFITLTEYAALLVLYYAVFFLFVYKKLGFIAVRPLLFLGTISYALYLVHDYVSIRIILPTLLKLTGHAFVLSGFLTLVVLIALATFLTYKIEIPARGYFKNKLEQWWLGKQPKAV
jgi:peptidoglycan/LPS O-acetylase OafA/YrhL